MTTQNVAAKGPPTTIPPARPTATQPTQLTTSQLPRTVGNVSIRMEGNNVVADAGATVTRTGDSTWEVKTPDGTVHVVSTDVSASASQS